MSKLHGSDRQQTFRELARIESVGAHARKLVARGHFLAAQRALRRVRGSFCVRESAQIIALVEADIAACLGDADRAKGIVLENLDILWGCADALEIFRRSHPTSNRNTKLLSIDVLGGCAMVGNDIRYTDHDTASFDVIADDESEAMHYIAEICRFATPETAQIVRCKSIACNVPIGTPRGVLFAYLILGS